MPFIQFKDLKETKLLDQYIIGYQRTYSGLELRVFTINQEIYLNYKDQELFDQDKRLLESLLYNR